MEFGRVEDGGKGQLRRADVGNGAALVGGEGIGAGELPEELAVQHQIGAEGRRGQRSRAEPAHERLGAARRGTAPVL